jgi:hypothetical protein
MAEILAQVYEQLTQAPPGLGRLPVRPQQCAKVITADRLAVRQGKTGQQAGTLARTDRNRIACHGLELGRTKKMEPVARHEPSFDTGLPNPVVDWARCQGELTSA